MTPYALRGRTGDEGEEMRTPIGEVAARGQHYFGSEIAVFAHPDLRHPTARRSGRNGCVHHPIESEALSWGELSVWLPAHTPPET